MLLRLVVLVGGAFAALFMAASAASADDGLGQLVGHVTSEVTAIPPKVVPSHVVPPKLVPRETGTAPLQRVVPEKAAEPKLDLVRHTEPVVKAVHKTVHETVRKTVVDAAKDVVNRQPTQGIPVVDDVVTSVDKTVSRTVAPVAKKATAKVFETADPVVRTVDPLVQAVAPVVEPTTPTTPVPPALVPQSAVAPPVATATVPAAAGHPSAVGVDRESPLRTGIPASSEVFTPTSATSAEDTFSGTGSGGPHGGLPTDLPHPPTAPVQGPVVSSGSGQPAGELAVLDAVLRDGNDGSTRPSAGDDGVPLDRAAVVDTRPA